MLVRLTPDQITTHWPFVDRALKEAIPPITYSSPETHQNILASLLRGGMHCWAIFVMDKEGAPVMLGYMITTVGEDGCSKVRNLIIYLLYMFKDVPAEVWKDGFETLRKFAKEEGCHRITAYSDNAQAIYMAKQLGARSRYRYITLEI